MCVYVYVYIYIYMYMYTLYIEDGERQKRRNPGRGNAALARSPRPPQCPIPKKDDHHMFGPRVGAASGSRGENLQFPREPPGEPADGQWKNAGPMMQGRRQMCQRHCCQNKVTFPRVTPDGLHVSVLLCRLKSARNWCQHMFARGTSYQEERNPQKGSLGMGRSTVVLRTL